MKLNSKIIGVLLIVMIFGGVGIAKLNGSWKTESSKEPKKFQSGEFAGQYNPEDIRGSYTFKNVEDSFEVDVDILAKAFGVEGFSDIANFQLKNLETIYAKQKENGIEIGTGSVRLFVALYNGLPYELVGDDYLPEEAVKILQTNFELSSQQSEYLDEHSISLEGVKLAEETVAGEGEAEADSYEENIIKGKTTFKEALEFGLEKEKIEEIIGYNMPSTGMTIRDFCFEKGLSFGEIKAEIQYEIDKN